jgi:hypothetical protein
MAYINSDFVRFVVNCIRCIISFASLTILIFVLLSSSIYVSKLFIQILEMIFKINLSKYRMALPTRNHCYVSKNLIGPNAVSNRRLEKYYYIHLQCLKIPFSKVVFKINPLTSNFTCISYSLPQQKGML